MKRIFYYDRFTLTFTDTAKKRPLTEKLNYLQKSTEVFFQFLREENLLKGPVEGHLTLCGSKMIRKLNNDFRKRDKVTDVLSFPVHQGLREIIWPSHPMDLGDIFICREKTKSQAKRFSLSDEEELVHLLVHGFLHLLGYDHEISLSEEKVMANLEEKLVEKILTKS